MPLRRMCLLLILVTPIAAPTLAQDNTLDRLEKLFGRDPAAAFEWAERLFATAEEADDLERMLDIIRVVAPASDRCKYWFPQTHMSEATILSAQRRGDWAALGEAYWIRARADVGFFRLMPGVPGNWWRETRFTSRAVEAYQKAGAVPPELNALLQRARREPPLDELGAHSNNPGWPRVPGYVQDAAKAVYRASYCPDPEEKARLVPEALSSVETALRQVAEDGIADRAASQLAFNALSAAVSLPDGDRLADLLWDAWVRSSADETLAAFRRQVPPGLIHLVTRWDGRDSRWLEQFQTAVRALAQRMIATPSNPFELTYPVHFMVPKLRAFGYHAEANAILYEWATCLREYMRLERATEALLAAVTSLGPHLVDGSVPPVVRREIMAYWSDLSLHKIEKYPTISHYWQSKGHEASIDHPSGNRVVILTECLKEMCANLPVQMRADAYPDAAACLTDTAARLNNVDEKARCLASAAEFLGLAGDDRGADELRSLAMALPGVDEELRLTCALIAAHAAQSREDFQRVVDTLQPMTGTKGNVRDRLDAAVVLARATSRLGQIPRSLGHARRAADLVPGAGMLAATQANYLVSLAMLVDDQTARSDFLARARAVATDSGLVLLVQQLAAEEAQAALDADDLPGARSALLTLVKQQESEREKLAYDPVLRQQWFADRVGPYRTLLRVAALQGDATLALDCAEKMRSRVLLDQLAWRKVDLAVNLPPALQAQLNELREQRKETYALLRRVTGASATTGGERGAYMPIRGVLDDGETAATDETKQLQTKPEALARQETALESAIREQIPAYERATSQQMLTAGQMMSSVTADPSLAVLEYTICDKGLAVLALRGGQAPTVAMIDVEHDALHDSVGAFREAIWERKPEALQQAADLYATLVAPVEDRLTDARRLWVIGDGALQLIPFGALRGADGRYLAERVALATTPSLSVALADLGARPEPELSALVIAAPDTGASELIGEAGERGAYMPIRGMYMPLRGTHMPIRGEGGVDSALTAMALMPLPGAKAEGQAVAEKFEGATLLTGPEATKQALIEQGRACDVLHIATHGYADPDVPEFSGLLLAGEGEEPYSVLTAQEVYLWDLRARLVTLSACQTAMGKTVKGEGVLGLTRAFIYAGAQNVVCSLWPVSDDSTKTLMESFYQNLETAGSVEEALALAQRSLIADEKTNHPCYWAAFVPVRGPK